MIEERTLEKLRAQRDALAQSLASSASEGTLPSGDLERLERVKNLIAIVTPKRTVSPLLVILLFASTAAIITLMATLRTCQTEIVANVRTNAVEFRMAAEDQDLLDTMNVASLSIIGAQRIIMPDPSQSIGARNGGLTATFTTSPATTAPGSLTLSQVSVPEGASVHVKAGPDGGWSITIRDKSPTLTLAFSGTISALLPGGARDVTSPTGATVITVTGGQRTTLFVTPMVPRGCVVCSETKVSKIEFMEVEEIERNVGTDVHQLSNVLGGTLHRAALGGLEYKLRRSEALRFQPERGTVTVDVRAASFMLNYQGRASSLIAGTIDNPKNLMPTWLEWAAARHTVLSAWAALLYVFGLISELL